MAWMAHRGPPEAVAKSNSPKNDLHLVLVGDDSEWRSLHLVWAHGTSQRPVPHYPPVGGYSATARIGTTMGHPGHPRGHNAPPRPPQSHGHGHGPRCATGASPGVVNHPEVTCAVSHVPAGASLRPRAGTTDRDQTAPGLRPGTQTAGTMDRDHLLGPRQNHGSGWAVGCPHADRIWPPGRGCVGSSHCAF